MGDIITYYQNGDVRFLMFVADPESGELVLVDMKSAEPVTYYGDVKQGFMGFYQYTKETDQWKLYLGIGNSSSMSGILLGDTLWWDDFPRQFYGEGCAAYLIVLALHQLGTMTAMI